MDSITGATVSGASRLSFAQKVVASGMSLVLAFGLSPLGQAPAYAEGPQTQAAVVAVEQSDLQTQDDPHIATFGDYTISVEDVTFDGAIWAQGTPKATGSGDSATVADRLLANGFLKIETTVTDSNKITKNITVLGSDSSSYTVERDKLGANGEVLSGQKVKQFTLSYEDPKGNTVDATHPIQGAGTYKVVLKGEGEGDFTKRQKLEIPFEVKRYSLDDVLSFDTTTGTTTPKNPVAMAYMGKPLTVHYDSNGYPKIASWKDPNGLTEPEAGKKYGVMTNEYTLESTDVTFSPSTVTDVDTHAVTLNGAGNFTGHKDVTATVVPGALSTQNNLTVNGAVNSASNIVTGKSAASYAINTDINVTSQQWIDLAKAEKNPTVSDPDPVADGKVVFGETPLKLGTDYEVEYFKGDPTDAGNVALEEIPSKIGKDYYAVIIPTSDKFVNDSTNTKVFVRYDITVGAKINQVADIADFGTVSYKAPTKSINASTTSAERLLDSQDSLAVPANVTFKDVDGNDVTSRIGDNYRALKVKLWTEDLEKEFLGDAGYKEKYPFSDKPYENSAGAVQYFKDIDKTEKAADKYDITAFGKTTTYYGFDGLPAGDYQLFVVGAKDYPDDTTATVYGKFTVAPATAVEGTGVGQLEFKQFEMAFVDDKLTGDDPVVKMHAGVDVMHSDKEINSLTLKKGSAYHVASGNADFSVTYFKDGEQVDPEEDGTYDVQYNFGGNNFQESSILVKDGMVLGKPQLKDVVKYAEIDTTKTYMYIGKKPVEPTINLYEKTPAEVAAIGGGAQLKVYKLNLKKDVDYTISYAGEGTAPNSPTAIGSYAVMLSGIGKYTSTYIKTGSKAVDKRIHVAGAWTDVANGQVHTPQSVADPYLQPAFKVEQLDLKKAINPSAGSDGKIPTPYLTVQFNDNGTWVDDYSVVVDSANPKPEPKFRLVTTASKNSKSPVEVTSSLYEGEFDHSRHSDDPTYAYGLHDATGVGTVVLNIKPSEDAKGDGLVAASNNGTGYFHVAAGSLTDEALGAKIVLTTDSGTREVESGTYDKDGQDLSIALKTNDGTLAVQYAPNSAGYANAQYIWEITKGNQSLKSTDSRITDDVSAAQQIKNFVKDAGTYTIKVSGGNSNEFAGSISTTFKVEPKEITSTDRKLQINWNYNDLVNNRFQFDGERHTAIKDKAGIVYDDEGTTPFTEAESIEKGSKNQYVISGHKGINAGEYTAKIEFCGNYTGTVEKTWTIRQSNIADLQDEGNLVILADNLRLYSSTNGFYNPDNANTKKSWFARDYNGSAQEPTVTIFKPTYASGIVPDGVSYTDLTPIKGLEYTYLYKDNTNATPDGNGRYYSGAAVTVVASGGNYTGRITKYFPITSKSISKDRVKVSFDNDDLVYTGKAVEPKGTLTYTNDDGSTFVMKYGTDYKVEYSGDNVNVGGNAVAKFVGLEPNFVGGNDTFVTEAFTVEENNRAPQAITVVGDKAITKKVGDAAFKIAASTNATDGKVEYASSDLKVATVDENGNVTIVGQGNATITLTAKATKLFNAADPVEVKLTVAGASAAKSANTLAIAKATKTVKGLKNGKLAKKKTVAGAKVKTAGQGKVTWKKVKVVKGKKAAKKAVAKKITVNKNNGKITLKKGLAKGTYKVTVSAQAAGDATAEASKVLKAVVTLKVKK